MAHHAPPIAKDAERLAADIEAAVARWKLDHKHGLGAQIRATATNVAVRINLAWLQPENRRQLVDALVVDLEKLKVQMQIGWRLKTFRSHAQFEHLARSAAAVGRQAGGWQQHLLHREARNHGEPARRERGKELSTRASHRGNQ